jgi:hypothetical protein
VTPTERLPAVIHVGGFDFRILLWDQFESNAARRYGECSTLEQTIRLARGFCSPEKAVDTFLHELLHAICWAFGREDEDKEERTVNLLATGLMSVHRSNPWLAEWIRVTLEESER